MKNTVKLREIEQETKHLYFTTGSFQVSHNVFLFNASLDASHIL